MEKGCTTVRITKKAYAPHSERLCAYVVGKPCNIYRLQGKPYDNYRIIYWEHGVHNKFDLEKRYKKLGPEYRTRAIITHGLYTFYPLFESHLCTVTLGLMYG